MQPKAKASQKFYLSEVITCWLNVVFTVPVKTPRWKAKSGMCSPPRPVRIDAVHKKWADGVRTVQTLFKMHPPTLLKVGLWPCTWVKCGFVSFWECKYENPQHADSNIWPACNWRLADMCWAVLLCFEGSDTTDAAIAASMDCLPAFYCQMHFALPNCTDHQSVVGLMAHMKIPRHFSQEGWFYAKQLFSCSEKNASWFWHKKNKIN